ncbi:hypothetical protein AMJ57_03655 [Parcubacteria bacterium SG8_24]|nr:MAG: hypothetical protein AMJ57_03655 [Parcubacteria bacterium SG8_24]
MVSPQMMTDLGSLLVFILLATACLRIALRRYRKQEFCPARIYSGLCSISICCGFCQFMSMLP